MSWISWTLLLQVACCQWCSTIFSLSPEELAAVTAAIAMATTAPNQQTIAASTNLQATATTAAYIIRWRSDISFLHWRWMSRSRNWHGIERINWWNNYTNCWLLEELWQSTTPVTPFWHLESLLDVKATKYTTVSNCSKQQRIGHQWKISPLLLRLGRGIGKQWWSSNSNVDGSWFFLVKNIGHLTAPGTY